MEIKSRNSDPTALPSRKALTHSPPEAIAPITQARVQGALPCKEK